VSKPTKNIEWLQDTIIGGAFLVKKLVIHLENDLGEGMRIQIAEFLSDAAKVERAYLARKKKQPEAGL
jgi:hypothetical protein